MGALLFFSLEAGRGVRRTLEFTLEDLGTGAPFFTCFLLGEALLTSIFSNDSFLQHGSMAPDGKVLVDLEGLASGEAGGEGDGDAPR